MKFKLVLLVGIALFTYQSSSAKARIPVPFGTEEKVIKIMDLPDNEYFEMDDGSYFDLGSMYTKSHILWLSYSNSDPVIVGYANEGESFVELSPEILAEIAEITGETIPTEGSISFFDQVIGRVLLGILALIVLYGLYSRFTGKDDEDEEPATPTQPASAE